MKKLMIAAMIALSAVVSQAATASWTITNVYDPASSTTKLANGSVYMFFYTSETLANTAVAGVIALEGKGLKAFTDAMAGANFSYDKQGTTDGTFSYTKALVGEENLPVVTTGLGLTEDTSYYGFAVIVDDTLSATDGDSKFYVTNTKNFTTATGSDGSSTMTIGSQGTASAVAGNWHAIPEPTSGLLLLLGMAGLALKRKRA